MSELYKKAGVSIEAGDKFVARIKEMTALQDKERVYDGIGGFAGLYKITDEKLLAVGMDGVGTKIKLAQEFNIHDTIGIDLVAMCVNDIICTGATPLFFLDYLAAGKLNPEVAQNIIAGVMEGTRQSECILLGGETAEMPGVYAGETYDLAAVAVGEVMISELIDGKNIRPGDKIIGLASSGAHSNGYSLLRRLFQEDKTEWKEELLAPTKIYVKQVKQMLKEGKNELKGLSHMTGGGLANISRINPAFDYHFASWPTLSKFFAEVSKRCEYSWKDLFATFNMGVGMTAVVAPDSPFAQANEIAGCAVYQLGEVARGSGKVELHYEGENYLMS